jgi:hypothetical protein
MADGYSLNPARQWSFFHIREYFFQELSATAFQDGTRARNFLHQIR